MIDAYAVDCMKKQVAKFFKFENWDDLQKELVDTNVHYGDFHLNFEELNEVFSGRKTDSKSEFDIGNNLVLVPYLSTGRSQDSAPIATYNLETLGAVCRNLECATVYKKIISSNVAYLLYIEAEGGLSLHEF